jgi:hypothetical protein
MFSFYLNLSPGGSFLLFNRFNLNRLCKASNPINNWKNWLQIWPKTFFKLLHQKFFFGRNNNFFSESWMWPLTNFALNFHRVFLCYRFLINCQYFYEYKNVHSFLNSILFIGKMLNTGKYFRKILFWQWLISPSGPSHPHSAYM